MAQSCALLWVPSITPKITVAKKIGLLRLIFDQANEKLKQERKKARQGK